MANQNYNDLIKKIDEFIRRFYLNKILRGSIYVSAILVALFLLILLSFYYFNPVITFKTIVFYSYLFLSIILIGIFIIYPLLSYLKLGSHISTDEASVIIGNHFENIKDKLLNTLQLHHLSEKESQNKSLILASIDQKIIELQPIPFYSAVKLNENKKYLKYLIVPIALIATIAILSPTIIKTGTNSFLKYDEYIAPKAPFTFNLLNKKLVFTQGDDIILNLKLTGDEFPSDVYVEDGNNTYKLEKENISNFIYKIKNIHNDKKLTFKGAGFNSDTYTITVKPRPELVSVKAILSYPAYLNKKSEVIDNAGDFLLPEGTTISWQFRTSKAKSLSFYIDNKEQNLNIVDDFAKVSSLIKQNSKYSIAPKNDFVQFSDSLTHNITVIKDQYPTINIDKKTDSTNNKQIYFNGEIADDYGFARLNFKYVIKENGKTISTGNKAIPINNKAINFSFLHFFDLTKLALKPNQEVEYYFEVTDNDGFNGPKTTKSVAKTFREQSVKENNEEINANSQAIKQKMQSAIKLAQTIERDTKKIAESLVDKKQLSFEDQKQIEQLLEKQKQLDASVEEIKKLNDKNLSKLQDQQQTEELAEKQKQIKDLFDNVLDEKTKDLLQKLQDLMNERDKDFAKDELSKMQLDNKTLKNELDRILQLYKQLEFEQNLQNNIDRLDDLAKKQKELAEKANKKTVSNKDLKEKQDELNKDLNEIKNDLKKLEEKNKSLDKPNDFNNPEKEIDDIQKDQQESKDALDKNDNQKAGKKQNEASQKISIAAQKMKDAQQQGAEMENNLNAKELRKLLENLLSSSFLQEKIMIDLKKLSTNDPLYTTNVQKQRAIKDNIKTIADSLYALSKRVPQIESTANDEMNKINFNIDKSLESLGERQTANANRFQQFTMTSLNNLSLMLSEALNQLQNSNKNSQSGKGNKKQGMKELSQMQDQLNKSMQKAKEQMQKSGNQGTVGKGEMSKEFSKMAQQQQMIRQALEKINREDNKDGKGKLGDLNQAIKDMKQTESELVNKRLQQETLNRQKDLLTKLLEAEKAEREQKEDDKRESKAGKDFPPNYLKMVEQFKKQQQGGTDLLQKLPPSLNYYYKNKIAEYLRALK
jgi:hypothetical protein